MIRRATCYALVLLALTAGEVVQAIDEVSCTITVRVGDSIQATIDAAPSGAVICLEAGTWRENVTIDRSLTLRGTGAGSTQIVGLEATLPVIDMRTDGASAGSSLLDVRIENLSVTGGSSGIQLIGLAKVALVQVQVQGSGGFGVYASDGQVAIENSTIRGNTSSGILIDSAHVTVKDSHVLSNLQNGIYILSHWTPSTVSLIGNMIAENAFFGVSLGDNFTGLLTGQDNGIPERGQLDENEIGAFSSDKIAFLTSPIGGRLEVEQEAPGSANSSQKTTELAYDSGVSDNGQGWGVADRGYGVRFTPPAGTSLLVGARLFVTGFSKGPAAIRIYVWDTDRTELIVPIEVTPTESGWFDVDLSAFGVRIVEEDFYIGYTQTLADQHPWIGNDHVVPTDRSYNLPDWSSVLPTGRNIMIRAVVMQDDGTPNVDI
jgi:hypothetical protein